MNISNKKDCCGCGSCALKCPKGCIKMKEDGEGFLYPVVDFLSCIRCGICEKVCPIQRKKMVSVNEEEVETYGAFSVNDDIRINSSSGGVFTIFASKILDLGGLVFGAAFDSNFSVRHKYVETCEELSQLRGSKYVQSDTKVSYQEVEEYLKQGRKVLFSGTPCQVEGLKSFLGKDHPNLYTIDILCHGVPSPKLWKEYLIYLENKYHSKIEAIDFRDKKYGWQKFCACFKFQNGHAIYEDINENYYTRMFIKNLTLRPSCFDCKFKGLDRASDVTIGDFWGIEKLVEDIDVDKGISIMIIHSDKGRELFELVRDKLVYFAVKTQDALPASADSRTSVDPHMNRDKYVAAISEEKPFIFLFDYLIPDSFNRLKCRIKRALITYIK